MSVAAGSSCSNQARIAERLGLDRTVMTYLIDDLEKAGLVERRPDPDDRRARQVLLTERGRARFQQAAQRIEHVERSVLAGLPDADAARFRELLMRVVATGPEDGAVNACDAAEEAAAAPRGRIEPTTSAPPDSRGGLSTATQAPRSPLDQAWSHEQAAGTDPAETRRTTP